LPVDQTNSGVYEPMVMIAIPVSPVTNLSGLFEVGIGQFSATDTAPSWFESVTLESTTAWSSGATLYNQPYWTNTLSPNSSQLLSGVIGFAFNPSGAVNYGLPGGGSIKMSMASSASGGYNCTAGMFYQNNTQACTFNATLNQTNLFPSPLVPGGFFSGTAPTSVSALTSYLASAGKYNQVYITLYPWSNN